MGPLALVKQVWRGNAGRIRLGLVLFVFLLGLVVGQFAYRYLTQANRLNDEAVELMNQGKYDSALALLDEALADSPNHVLATYHRGLCLTEKHRWDEALAAFDRTSRLDPGHALAHFNKGRILWMQSAFDQAIPALTRATDLKSPYPDAWVLMAECHYEIYLRDKAADPASSASPAQATAAFKTYLKQRPDASDAQTVERKLEVLQHVERYPEVLAKRKPQPRPD